MRYISLDIETTGLDREKDQLLEIGAVMDDLMSLHSIEALPTIRVVVLHKRIEGNPKALAMHPKLFEEIAAAPEAFVPGTRYALTPADAVFKLATWIAGYYKASNKVIFAGKNVGTFDIPWLDQHGFSNTSLFTRSYQYLDPTALYMRPDDYMLPNTVKCLERAGIEEESTHSALGDAMLMVKLIRHKMIQGE